MKIFFLTHGCKANQYDTETFRQELVARGATLAHSISEADACVINTCTVTNAADADARKAIRKAKRENPSIEIFVAGCSAALKQRSYLAMEEVRDVVKGHNPLEVAQALSSALPDLTQHEESIGGVLLKKNRRGVRGWLKIQDGCDRKCSFCATRLARGQSRSRSMEDILAEATLLAQSHHEIVLTGVHIGHYGVDLSDKKRKEFTLGKLLSQLVDQVHAPSGEIRFRLGSIEATEIDDELMELVCHHPKVASHFHIPMQSGSNAILQRMKRWHTREQYYKRVYDIAQECEYLGLGADIIVGFPGESEQDYAATRELVNSLPFNYAHVFPYSLRDDTTATLLEGRIAGNVSAQRSRDLRALVHEKGQSYIESRLGTEVQVVVEENGRGLTEDYLRVAIKKGSAWVGKLKKATLLGKASAPQTHLL